MMTIIVRAVFRLIAIRTGGRCWPVRSVVPGPWLTSCTGWLLVCRPASPFFY